MANRSIIIFIQCLMIFFAFGVVNVFAGEVEYLLGTCSDVEVKNYSPYIIKVRHIKNTNIYRAWIDEEHAFEVVQELRNDKGILFVERSKSLEPQFYGDNIEWKRVNSLDYLQSVSNGAGITVAVLDTGFDLTNQDLAEQLWTNPGEVPDDGIDNDLNGYVDDLYGLNTGGLNNGIADKHGHGTQVSSIILSVAPECKIMSIKLNKNQSDYFSIGAIVEGVYYAVQNGADLLNMSFSGKDYSFSLAQALEQASEAGCILLGAAGNNNKGNVEFPANLTEVMAVGSTDMNGEVSDFSAYGSELEVLAVGENIRAIDLNNFSSIVYGTSFSTAVVSGAWAVLKSLNPFLQKNTQKGIICNTISESAQETLLQSTEIPELDGKKISKTVTPKVSFPFLDHFFVKRDCPLHVKLYLPPTDIRASLYLLAEQSNRQWWWLDQKGTWHNYKEESVNKLCSLPAYSNSFEITLFGENGIFPGLESPPFSYYNTNWYVVLTDPEGRFLSPIMSSSL